MLSNEKMKTIESTFLNLLIFLKRLVSILLLSLSNFANTGKIGYITNINAKDSGVEIITKNFIMEIIIFVKILLLY